MKKIIPILFCLLTISAFSQTVDDIIQKYANTMGGLSAFNAIKTLKMTGTVTTQGMDLPLTVQIINGRATRNDVEAMGQAIVNAYKDGKGWKINPFAGVATATDMTKEELIDFKTQSMLANNLMDYKARGHKVELLGQEDVEGIKTYKIKLTAKEDGKITTYYISTSDNMMVKATAMRNIQGQDVEIENFFSNIKEFNGVKFAMTRTQKMNGQVFQEITYNTIEIDVPIDEKIFDRQ